jgi:predicted polyphosphate/ATP-dependent NAD kinase
VEEQEIDGRSIVGLVLNPVAGMGGRVGLKGTDGADMLTMALGRGAEPVSPACILRFLDQLGDRARAIQWLTCSGDMGADILIEAGLLEGDDFSIAYHVTDQRETGPDDTRRACRKILDAGVDLLVFCGGDGTARDVLEEIGDEAAVVGVPAGVKMFSGIFAVSPEAAGEIIAAHLEGTSEVGEGDVVDVDEEAYRRGQLAVTLFGTMRVLRVLSLIQDAKHVTPLGDESKVQDAIARYVVELLEEEGDPITILGAGTTVEAVARRLDVPNTPLGVDVVRGGEVVVTDASEEDLLRVLSTGKGEGARIVMSPIGAQGFLLGRGNQQISPAVLEAAGGPAALMIVATPHKVRSVPVLLVDTGDGELDMRLAGMRQVISGYHDVIMMRVEAASAPTD